LTATKNGEDYNIQQCPLTGECPAAGESFINVMRTLKSAYRTTPIGLKRDQGKLKKIPEPTRMVQEDDYMLLIPRGDQESGLEDYFGTEEGVLIG